MGIFFKNSIDLGNQGLKALERSKYSKADKLFKKAIAKDDGTFSSALYYFLAISQLRQEKVEQGLQNMRTSAEMGDDDAIEFLNSLQDDNGLVNKMANGVIRGLAEEIGKRIIGTVFGDEE